MSAAGVIMLGVFAGAIGSGLGGPTVVRYVDDLATVAAALAATVLCVAAAGRHSGRLRLFWRLLAAASASWSVGELVWAFYDLVLPGPVPVPSWADAGYLAAVPLAAAALLTHPALRGRAVGKTRSVLDGLAIAAALFFIAWTLLVEPLWRSTDLTTLGGLVALAYPLGDVVVVFLIVLVIRGLTSRDRLDLWCLLIGLLAMTLGDVVYGYLTEVAGYATGNLIDAAWVGAYLAIAAAAYASRPRLETEPVREPPTLAVAALVAPFVPVLAALGLAAIQIDLGHRPDRVAWTTAVLLVVIVLLRQAMLVIDLRAPGPRTQFAHRLVTAAGSPGGDRRADPWPSHRRPL